MKARLKINRIKFYVIVAIVIFAILIFLNWSLGVGSGESNLGGWLIYIIIPKAVFNAILIIGISLVIKKIVFNKIFDKKQKHPIITAVLSILLTTTIFGYFTIPSLFVQESSYLPLTYIGVIFIGIPAIAITFFAYLLRANQPNIWRFNLGPATITYSLWMFILLFMISGLNFLFMKASLCNFVVGDLPNSNCYYTKAVKTTNVNFCAKIKDRSASDCVVAIAIYKEDPSFCYSPILEDLPTLYAYPKDICLYELSVATNNKSLCDHIEYEDQRISCLEYKPSSIEEISEFEKQYELERKSRPFLEKLRDFFNGYY